MTTKYKETKSRSTRLWQLGLAASASVLLTTAVCPSVSQADPSNVHLKQTVTEFSHFPIEGTEIGRYPKPDSWGRLPPSTVVLGTPGGAIWKFKSKSWDGYIDIRTDGRYYTHWGYGHWGFQKDGSIILYNDYDPYSHHLKSVSKTVWKGARNDGDWERLEFVWDYAHEKKSEE